VALLDDVIHRLSRDRRLTFHLDGQTILIEDYLEARPEQRSRVQRLVEAGRLTLGPWYVLADELLAGDEPLVRNLLVGQRQAAALGAWLPVGYSPDAFGHPDMLPAILRGFGIADALLWRGYRGRRGEGRDLFEWTAPDGSTVLVHHLPPAGYEFGAELPTALPDMRLRWRAMADVLEPRALVPVLLVLNGADHHALQPDLDRAVRALRRVVPDATVEVSTLDAYFAAARAALARTGRSPRRVAGELRWSYGYTWTLQGVAATRTALKQRIAEGAALLTRWAEPQAALAPGAAAFRPLLAQAWRTHLANLFHDTLAGSTVDAVAREAAVRADAVVTQARGLLEDALDARLGQDAVRRRRERRAWRPALVLVNPSPRPRSGVGEAAVTRFQSDVVVGRPGGAAPGAPHAPFHLVDARGRVVPHQVLQVTDAYERLDSPRDYPDQDRVWAVRVAVRARDVPAFGLARLDVRDGAAPAYELADAVSVRGTALRASWGGARATRDGFTVVVGGRTLRLSPALMDERDEGDTYTIQPVAGERPLRARWGRARVVWAGPLVAALARPFRIGSRARGTIYVRIEAGSQLVRIAVEGANLAGQHRLRFVVPVGADDQVTADVAFGASTRRRETARQRPGQEAPATTAPMHRYVSAGGWTVCARGLHEYELLPDGALAVTLLRAVGDLSRGDLPARPGHAGWPTATPGAQGLGAFRAEMALAPVGVSERDPARNWDAVESGADEFHAPLAARMYRSGIDVPEIVEGPALSGAGLAFRALKPREEGEGIVLRCVNVTRQARRGAWTFPYPVTRAFRARLDESVEAELPLSDDRRRIEFAAGPRGIVTVVVEG
jgi:mannosylglycerate hydrolase